MRPDDSGARADQALARLRDPRRSGPEGARRFTCDLSVDELLLVEEAGYEPLALVSGNSIYNMQLPPFMWGTSQEVTVLSSALYSARHKAMDGMQREAARMGGQGVVGVRLTLDLESWGEGLGEFLAVGTAVRASGSQPTRTVFTSNLSGRDFYSLVQGGYHPVSMVMGACVWHLPRRTLAERMGGMRRNYELEAYTACLYSARELAMTRMAREAETAQASGVVGVTIEEKSHVWGAHTLEFLALGTAITARSGEPPHVRPAPTIGLHKR
jgi:uncharacterized protein YbjQ (UPF0145 family)